MEKTGILMFYKPPKPPLRQKTSRNREVFFEEDYDYDHGSTGTDDSTDKTQWLGRLFL